MTPLEGSMAWCADVTIYAPPLSFRFPPCTPLNEEGGKTGSPGSLFSTFLFCLSVFVGVAVIDRFTTDGLNGLQVPPCVFLDGNHGLGEGVCRTPDIQFGKLPASPNSEGCSNLIGTSDDADVKTHDD